MALTVSDLITDAETLAYPFIGPQKPARGPLLRALSALDASFAREIANARPELLSTQATAITIGDNAANLAGYSLQSALSWTDFKYVDKDANVIDLYIVPERFYDEPQQNPSAIIQGVTLLPCDPNMKRWDGTTTRLFFKGDGDTVEYNYIPFPGKLAGLSSTLVSPDFVRDWFVYMLALQVALSGGAGEMDLVKLKDEADLQGAKAQLQIYRQVPMNARFGEK